MLTYFISNTSCYHEVWRWLQIQNHLLNYPFNTLTRWRLVPSIFGLGSMGNAVIANYPLQWVKHQTQSRFKLISMNRVKNIHVHVYEQNGEIMMIKCMSLNGQSLRKHMKSWSFTKFYKTYCRTSIWIHKSG